MKTAIFVTLFLISTTIFAQPLDDVHLSGLVRGYFGQDTTQLSGAMVIIENYTTSHSDTVLTNANGQWSWTGISDAVGDDNPAIPTAMTLSPNYPNPFTGSTTVTFKNNAQQKVKLSVYNILGQRVTELVDENLHPGGYELKWNGLTKDGARLAQGIYFLCLNANGKTITRKIVLLGSGTTSDETTLREFGSGFSNPSNPAHHSHSPAQRRSLDDFSLQVEFHQTGYDSVCLGFTLQDGEDTTLVATLHRLNTPPALSAVWITSIDSTETQPLTGHAIAQDENHDQIFWTYD
jgi:hypothetical protein